MDDIIKIKCPFDGAVLSVKNMPGLQSKSVTCPVCKHTYPFTKFQKLVDRPVVADDDSTQYGGSSGRNRYQGEDTTQLDLGGYGNNENQTIGRVRLLNGSRAFQLRQGNNVIGRLATRSNADFQIDTGNSNLMSREHIIIKVEKVPGKGYVHYLSLAKNKVNPTFVGSERLCPGDCIILTNGNVIKLPDASLIFELIDR